MKSFNSKMYLVALLMFSTPGLLGLIGKSGRKPGLQRTLLGDSCPPRIKQPAPSFKGQSTNGPINFPQDFAGKWIIFFSHPADFTPVCTTEFKRLAQMADELKKKYDTEIVGLSEDTQYTHEIWMRNLEKQMQKEGKKKRTINFPVISDPKKRIAQLYGMIHPRESLEQTVRSVFIIDPQGLVRASFFYPIANGRNFNEIKRLLIAIQTADRDNVATPEDWKPGQKTIPKAAAMKDVMPD